MLDPLTGYSGHTLVRNGAGDDECLIGFAHSYSILPTEYRSITCQHSASPLSRPKSDIDRRKGSQKRRAVSDGMVPRSCPASWRPCCGESDRANSTCPDMAELLCGKKYSALHTGVEHLLELIIAELNSPRRTVSLP